MVDNWLQRAWIGATKIRVDSQGKVLAAAAARRLSACWHVYSVLSRNGAQGGAAEELTARPGHVLPDAVAHCLVLSGTAQCCRVCILADFVVCCYILSCRDQP